MLVKDDVNKNLIPLLKPNDRVFEIYEYKHDVNASEMKDVVGWKIVRGTVVDKVAASLIALVAYVTLSLITMLVVGIFSGPIALCKAGFITAICVIVYSMFTDPMDKYLS
jgi:hypothetical protein